MLRLVREALEIGAQMAAIFALLFAVIAYFKPDILSNYFAEVSTSYLRQIQENSESSSDSLNEIEGSSSTTAEATQEIAEDLATWLRPEAIDPMRAQMHASISALSGGSGFVVGISVYNDTGHTFRNVDIIATLNERLLFEETDVVIPSREFQDLVEPVPDFESISGIGEICISATSDKDGVRRYEYRRLRIDQGLLVTVDHKLETSKIAICQRLARAGQEL